jgi:hypothetical protein
MKKFLFPLVALFALVGCTDFGFQASSLGGVSENTISETVIEETTIVANPIRKAYLDSLQSQQAGFNEYQTNELIPLVDFRVTVPNTVQTESAYFYYDMANFEDEHLTYAALITNVVGPNEAVEDGWITAAMGYGLERTYHYDFITSIGADWFNGQYSYYENPSQVNAMSGGGVTWNVGKTYIHYTLAWNDSGTVRFLPIGSYFVIVKAA